MQNKKPSEWIEDNMIGWDALAKEKNWNGTQKALAYIMAKQNTLIEYLDQQ